jgi:hypothetical protein
MHELHEIANHIRNVGQRNSRGGQDVHLAHINDREVALLKLLGGSGRTDPETGVLHFDDSSSSGDGTSGGSTSDSDNGYGGSSQGDNGQGDGQNSTSQGSGYAGTTNSANYGYSADTGWSYSAPGQTNESYGWGQGEGPTMSMADVADMLGLGGVNAGPAGQGVNGLASATTAQHEDIAPDENSVYGYGPSAFSTGTAAQAGNSVASNNAGPGGRGDTFDAVTNAYESSPTAWNAENNFGGGVSGYSQSVLDNMRSWVEQNPGLAATINTALGFVNPGLGLFGNLATGMLSGRGDQSVLSALGGYFGGPVGRAAGSLAGDVMDGRSAQQTLADALSQGLGYGLGNAGVSLGKSGYDVAGIPGAVLGELGQGYATGAAGQGLASALGSAPSADGSSQPGGEGGGSSDSHAESDAASGLAQITPTPATAPTVSQSPPSLGYALSSASSLPAMFSPSDDQQKQQQTAWNADSLREGLAA